MTLALLITLVSLASVVKASVIKNSPRYLETKKKLAKKKSPIIQTFDNYLDTHDEMYELGFDAGRNTILKKMILSPTVSDVPVHTSTESMTPTTVLDSSPQPSEASKQKATTASLKPLFRQDGYNIKGLTPQYLDALADLYAMNLGAGSCGKAARRLTLLLAPA